MGRTHAFAVALANRVFDLPSRLRLVKIADASNELAEKAANELGFDDYTGNWKDLISDPEIDVINITSPNSFHKEMAIAAIKAGKHVYCEKPLATSVEDAEEMRDAAEFAGVKTQVGFNYICNPMLRKARQMILSGELGDIRGFRGVHAEDYMAADDSLFTWRHDPLGGGALADLGSHVIATAEYLVGPIDKVLGDCETVTKRRIDSKGREQAIEVDDVTRAFIRFKNGASGSIEANWMATGRKMQHDFEIFGSKGALFFSQERLNELKFYCTEDEVGEQGFRTIWAGPEHQPYDRFCVAGGHQLGFCDLKAIEVEGFVKAIHGLVPEPFNFDSGYRVQRIVELIQRSSEQTKWVTVGI